MAFVNFNAKEITAKIVYYGPGLGGKTSSLQYIYNNLPEENKGKMISLATDEDRTIYFDFLPLHLGKIQNFTVKVQLYTVPGQVRYNATRKLVLKGVDGLVFVADSQIHRKFSNIESYSNLEENLAAYHKNLKDVAHVIQYNKIDLPNIIHSEELNQIINKYSATHFETCAISGIGIMDSLKTISKLVFSELSKKGITSRAYLLEKQTPAEEYEITSESEKEVKIAEEPHELIEDTEPQEEEPQEVFEDEAMEELSSDDVEIIHEDLHLIEPSYAAAAKPKEEDAVADAFEQDIIRDEPSISPQLIVPDKDYQEKRGEIEFDPEHFSLSEEPVEEPIVKEPIIEVPQKKLAPFEELEDIGSFHELEPESVKGEKASGVEEDAFSEFLDEAIPSDVSPLLSPDQIKPEEKEILPVEDVFEESKPEIVTPKEILSEGFTPKETTREELITKELVPEEVIPDEFVPKEIIPEKTISEEIVSEEFAPEEVIEEEVIAEEIIQGEPIQEPKPNEFFADEITDEILEDQHPEEILEIVKPAEIISEEIPQEDLVSDAILGDLSAEEVQFEEPAEIIEVTPVYAPEPIPEPPVLPEESIQELEPALIAEEPVSITLNFSYSTAISNDTIHSAVSLLEEAMLNNQYDDMYTQASFIFSEITSLLTNKYKFCDAKSQAELLWLIGIQPNDYYVFIKTLAALKEQKKGHYIYYIHNFLMNLLFKSQLIPVE